MTTEKTQDHEDLLKMIKDFRAANEQLLLEIGKADPNFRGNPLTAIAFKLDAFGLKLDTLAQMVMNEFEYAAFEASFESRMNGELLKLKTKVTQNSLTQGVTPSGLFVAKK